MARPPDDESRFDAILEEVRGALDEAGIAGEQIREALLTGVKEALGDLGEKGEDHTPEMTVVDGGRTAHDPRAEGPSPELTIASEPDAPGASRVKVFVSRGDSVKQTPAQSRGGEVPSGCGAIAITDDTQTVFHGAVERPYRLHCVSGELQVSLDGQPAERVGEGQSLDVEARLIRLSARETARGWYQRLT